MRQIRDQKSPHLHSDIPQNPSDYSLLEGVRATAMSKCSERTTSRGSKEERIRIPLLAWSNIHSK